MAMITGLLLILPLFAMDLQEAAKKDTAALVERNEHLTELAVAQRCAEVPMA
jgi:hypothetical protein